MEKIQKMFSMKIMRIDSYILVSCAPGCNTLMFGSEQVLCISAYFHLTRLAPDKQKTCPCKERIHRNQIPTLSSHVEVPSGSEF